MAHHLSVLVGKRAAATLREEGWSADIFGTLLGASGGPKWLILGGLDRVLSRFLVAGRQRPLAMVGSSIGTWRHACLTQPDPVAAIDRFETAYVAQSYSTKPTPAEVSAVATDILSEALGSDGASRLVSHPLLHNHIVTARAAGIAKGRSTGAIAAGMGAAALANALHRGLLQHSFRRVVFSAPLAMTPAWLSGFDTTQVLLRADNVVSALKASGAIPLVLEPERNIPGAPEGHYWDGGIIDYHFELPEGSDDGLFLYPHFTHTLTPGWFDKFLPWRAGRQPDCRDLVLLSPSAELVASLPFGKIPDRRDFQRLDTTARQRYWQACIDAGRAIGEAFEALIDSDDPLRHAVVIDG